MIYQSLCFLSLLLSLLTSVNGEFKNDLFLSIQCLNNSYGNIDLCQTLQIRCIDNLFSSRNLEPIKVLNIRSKAEYEILSTGKWTCPAGYKLKKALSKDDVKGVYQYNFTMNIEICGTTDYRFDVLCEKQDVLFIDPRKSPPNDIINCRLPRGNIYIEHFDVLSGEHTGMDSYSNSSILTYKCGFGSLPNSDKTTYPSINAKDPSIGIMMCVNGHFVPQPFCTVLRLSPSMTNVIGVERPMHYRGVSFKDGDKMKFCNEAPELTNGHFIGECERRKPYRIDCKFECNSGYVQGPKSKSDLVSCINGKWSTEMVCELSFKP